MLLYSQSSRPVVAAVDIPTLYTFRLCVHNMLHRSAVGVLTYLARRWVHLCVGLVCLLHGVIGMAVG